ncbi:MAG: transporter, family, nitrate/nitrite transporter [Solirubrobacteraceae bacterium]|jgi:NNP family nitrate/nitrite transporter-like MFS transporter|nr:transporter, family, nitrate/nitrite transporter [Solirubrobacteraceae bacterium]MEA2241453.1 transporter, family, nitrate/nitrite transporter [Solirubrobacteraceae bacterium]
MSTTTAGPVERTLTTTGSRRGRWLDDWDPEDEAFWKAGGRKIARKNLAFSIFAEHLGFSIWVLWTIVVINLANAGFQLSLSEQFLLIALPNLVGSALRIPYTFAVPRFGGRLWTTISASLLLIPVLLLAILVPSGWLAHQTHSTQMWVLALCAATAGFGGGNFSSSMANISFFYPERRKGFALGLNAAGGNLGVAVTQLLVPLVIIIGVPAAAVKLTSHEVHLSYAGLMWLPFIVVAALGAWLYMDSITAAKSDARSYAKSVKQPQTWVMSLLYIGTFGSFIGYAFALPLVIKNTFPEFLAAHPFIATYLAGLGFAGALIGSIARPLGGWMADKLGGARVTLAVFLGEALFTVTAIVGVNRHSFPIFFGSFMAIFLLAGMGNGSTYRMIPSIFSALGRKEADEQGVDHKETALDFRRQAAAVIGIAGAVGAFGGFLIQVAFRQASLPVSAAVKAAATPADKLSVAQSMADWAIPALYVFLGAYLVFAAITWFFYLRTSFATDKVKSLAYASI